MIDSDLPIVVVVEEDDAVVAQYEEWLDGYEVLVAEDGGTALEMIDDWVDVVLLDRTLPDLSGGEVLREIRAREYDVRVVIVTDVEPDFDIIDMGFDAYIHTPSDREAFRDTVEEVSERATLREQLQEYYSLMSRKGALETWKTEKELAASEGYANLLERIEKAEAAVDESAGDMASESEFVGAVRELSDDTDEEKLDEWEETVEESDDGDGGTSEV